MGLSFVIVLFAEGEAISERPSAFHADMIGIVNADFNEESKDGKREIHHPGSEEVVPHQIVVFRKSL